MPVKTHSFPHTRLGPPLSHAEGGKEYRNLPLYIQIQLCGEQQLLYWQLSETTSAQSRYFRYQKPKEEISYHKLDLNWY
jgi:hypothetical protein